MEFEWSEIVKSSNDIFSHNKEYIILYIILHTWLGFHDLII